MLATAIQEDVWDDADSARTDVAGLSEADARAIAATLDVLGDASVAHPAAAIAALLRHFVRSPDDIEARLAYAADELARIAKDGVRATLVDLGVR